MAKSTTRSRAEKAAAITQKQERSERLTKVLIVAVVAVVAGAIIGAGVWFSVGGKTATPDAGATATPPASADGTALVVGDNADAKIKVVIYEDFLCPYCREFETSSRDFLHAAAAKGQVQIEYRPFQLLPDDYSKNALNVWAAVLQKGTGAQALKLHDKLFDDQPYEAATDKPDQAQLIDWAKSVGAPEAALTAAGTENTTFHQEATKAAQAAGVQGTPTIVVNGEPLQGNSIDDMASTLEKMIAEG